jgi:tyrosyl-tRNA synthetase
VKKEIERHLDCIKENAVDVISLNEISAKLEKSLAEHKPLNLKIGFDPTARDIHLGHTVLLRKLRKLQDLGHVVNLIIGDFTAKIGDPSGRSILRPVLSDEEIKDNASTYTDQAFKILDKQKTKIIFNSSWYKSMGISQFLSLLSSYTVARMLERDDFALRIKENRPLTIVEMVYPLIQGYDSVMMNADIEFGGTDQKFNLIVGRHLQEVYGKPSQAIVTMPILVGLDGVNKMSKSLGNYIGVTEEPKSMFGKLMSISDEDRKSVV